MNPLKGIPYCEHLLPASLLLPAEPQCLGDEAVDVRILQDGLGGGLPGAVPAAGVHPDHQRLALPGAAAHPLLQRRAVLQGVEGHHAVIVVPRQQQDGREGGAGVRGLRQIMERRIPGERRK